MIQYNLSFYKFIHNFDNKLNTISVTNKIFLNESIYQNVILVLKNIELP